MMSTTRAFASPTQDAQTIRVAFVGNPNTGKTTLFNILTGLNQKVGNYPGVTVERKVGRLQRGSRRFELVDLPGTYSLAARSLDEMVVTDILLGQQEGEDPVQLVVAVVDAGNLNRNFYLLSQIFELGLPVIVALNMIDLAESKGITVDAPALSKRLGVPVVPICASKKQGVDILIQQMEESAINGGALPRVTPSFPEPYQHAVQVLRQWVAMRADVLPRPVQTPEIFRALIDEGGYAETRLVKLLGPEFYEQIKSARVLIESKDSLVASEAILRYQWISGILNGCVQRPARPAQTASDRVDRILTHKVYGFVIFIVLMALVFQSIYSWAAPIMDFIDGLFGATGDFVLNVIPEGALRSLIVDGIIGGVGGVLIFLPQIAILFFFLGILEDCGYMPRAAFMMDRILAKCGLSGKSFIPLLSSFACAIPGVMATRTIENPRARLVTILIAPLMSCSARLPVYLILIAAFVPSTAILGGWFNLQALSLLLFYMLGITIAIPMALLFKKFLSKGETMPFVMEFPSYKWPMPRSVALYVYEKTREFVIRAGTIIFCFSVIIWALSYFPHSRSIEEKYNALRERAKMELHMQAQPLLTAIDAQTYPATMTYEAMFSTVMEDPRFSSTDDTAQDSSPANDQARQVLRLVSEYQAKSDNWDNEQSGEYVRTSFLGRMGRAIEPVVLPLGWDWRIGMAALSSFPARELVVASLGTILNVGSNTDETSTDLRTALVEAKREDGTPLFNLAVALSVMVFFALCAQCISTLAIIKRETNSWRWPLITFGYMTFLAYFGAMLMYQAGRWLGWG